MSVVAPIATFQGIIPKGREGPLSDIGECLNGENFYSLKEGRAKIVGFLLSARQATLRSLFGGAMGDVRALS